MNTRPARALHRAALLFGLLAGAASSAYADVLVSAGQRAMLTVSVTVEGAVEKPQGNRGEVVKWSTRRAFDATVEMVADKAGTTSIAGGGSGQTGAQQEFMAELRKQAEACGQDQACQMQLAMQMMNASALQEVADAPPRYQTWRPAPKGGRLDVIGSHEETLHTVFYTAARETTDCRLKAPMVSPELTRIDANADENWGRMNRETLANGARSFAIEVDDAQKSSLLRISSPLSVGSGDIQCTRNIGSGPETSHHSTNVTLLPTAEISLPLLVKGSAPGDKVIASGSARIDSKQALKNIGVGFAVDVTAPIIVAVRWELKTL